MSETLFFDKTYELKQSEKWRKRNVKTEIVSLRFGTQEPYEWREREVFRAGDLCTYQRILTDSDAEIWIIGHIPTGYQVGPEFASRADAVLFLYLVRDADWSFTASSDAPADGRMELMREAAINASATFVPGMRDEGDG